jgi:transcription elongation factor Elf1
MTNSNEGLMSFVVPTEFVELPSGGRYYPQGHPLHNQETIEIKHMTAREEDLLTSRALLKKGLALDRLLESVIIDKKIRASDLLVGDRNAILISTRISGYGPDYDTKITCPSCGTQQDYEFDLSNIDVYVPRTKLEVTYRLLNGHDEKNFINQVENARKTKKEERTITRQLKSFIVSVNGDATQKSINYVAENLPSIDARHLRTVQRLSTPNIDLIRNFECDSCGHEELLEVPLTADFFWPDR